MQDDPQYATVNQMLAVTMPAVTKAQILPYYLRLVKHFMRSPDEFSESARYRAGHQAARKVARSCWASTKTTTGNNKGWGRMMHDAAHYVHRLRHPKMRPHDPAHAKLEREMVEYVLAHGWMSEASKPKLKRTADDKLMAIRNRIVVWTVKRNRAENALKKLRQKEARLLRKLENKTQVTT